MMQEERLSKMEKIEIGFLTDKPLSDVRAWSGTIYHLNHYLSSANYKVYEILVKDNYLLKLIKFLFKKIFNIDPKFLYKIRKIKAHRLVKKYCTNGIKIFFVPAGSKFIDDYVFDNECKVIYLTDANIYSMRNYYRTLTDRNFNTLNELEIKAAKRADAIIVSSEWAKSSFINNYDCVPSKIYVSMFPAYLPDRFEEKKYKRNELRMLFVGLEWERKGADIAIQAFMSLKQKMPNCEVVLDIVGLNNEKNLHVNNLNFWGRLDKLNEKDLNVFINLYKKASLFILPTKAECAGIVFSEACLYGLPIFTTNTGGIGSYVVEGYNGFKLDLSADGVDFANAIEKNFYSLSVLSVNARSFYEKKLSISIWQKKFDDVIKAIKS